MEPKLPDRAIVIADYLTYRFREPKEGDVILFNWEGKKLIKRIVGFGNGYYDVAGDNQTDSLSLPPLSRDKIIAKIIVF